MSKLLVWCAEDVSGYQPLTYIFDEGSRKVRSILSAAALFEHVNPDFLLVFIPEVLFYRDHEQCYIKLIKAKIGYVENGIEYCLFDIEKQRELTVRDDVDSADLGRFIKALEDPTRTFLVRVPHPGEASAIVLEERLQDRRRVIEISRQPVEGSGSFSTMVNVMFYSISQLLEDRAIREIHVDLTHGTNIIVQALFLTMLMIRELYDVNVNFWTAPMIGKEVKFENISDVVTVSTGALLATLNRRYLDDRLARQSINVFKKLERVLGRQPQFREVYNIVKDMLNIFTQLCWMLRTGQILAAMRHMYELIEKVQKASESTMSLAQTYLNCRLWREFSQDEPWAPVIYAFLKSLREYVDEVYSHIPLEIVLRNLRLMHERGYYVQVLLIARELLILLLLIYLGFRTIEIKSELWTRLENILTLPLRAGDRVEQLVKEFRQLEGLKDFLLNKLVPVFDSLQEFRNKLAHGLLNEGTQIDVDIVSRWIIKYDMLTEEKLRALSENIINCLFELYQLIKKKWEEAAKCAENILHKYLNEIEQSYREFREKFTFRE